MAAAVPVRRAWLYALPGVLVWAVPALASLWLPQAAEAGERLLGLLMLTGWPLCVWATVLALRDGLPLPMKALAAAVNLSQPGLFVLPALLF